MNLIKRFILIICTTLLGLTISGCEPEFSESPLPHPIMIFDTGGNNVEVFCDTYNNEPYTDFSIDTIYSDFELDKVRVKVNYFTFIDSENMYCYSGLTYLEIPLESPYSRFSTIGIEKRSIEGHLKNYCLGLSSKVRIEIEFEYYFTNGYFTKRKHIVYLPEN